MTTTSQTTGPVRPNSVEELQALEGNDLGYSGWITVDQPAINSFADVTGDHQWIHVDLDRAAASAFGTTIGHGLLTLSYGPPLLENLLSFNGFAQALNYGYEKVRFPSALPAGTDVRMRAEVVEVRAAADYADVSVKQTFEARGLAKPVCVATQIIRFIEN